MSLINISNGEAIVQLSVALNLAYFAFRELRSPVKEKRKRIIDIARSEISELRSEVSVIQKPKNLLPGDEETSVFFGREKLEFELNMHAYNIEGYSLPFFDNDSNIDSAIRILAIVTAFFGMVILLIIASNPNYSIPFNYIFFATLVLYLPAFLSAGYNIGIAGLIKDGNKKALSIREKVVALRENFKNDLFKRHITLVENQKLDTKKS